MESSLALSRPRLQPALAISNAAQAVKSNHGPAFFSVLLIAAIAMVISFTGELVSGLARLGGDHGLLLIAAFFSMALSVLSYAISSYVTWGAMVRLTDPRGEQKNFDSLFSSGWRCLPLGLVLTVIFFVAGVALGYFGASLFIDWHNPASQIAMIDGTTIVVIAIVILIGIFASVYLVAAPGAVVAEKMGVWASIDRSITLVRGNFWRVVGTGLILLGLTIVLVLILGVVVTIIYAIANDVSLTFGVLLGLVAILPLIYASVIFSAFAYSVLADIYWQLARPVALAEVGSLGDREVPPTPASGQPIAAPLEPSAAPSPEPDTDPPAAAPETDTPPRPDT